MTKAAAKKKDDVTLYDGTAPQRIPFAITEGSEKFETAHQVKALSDEKFLAFVDSVDPDAPDLTEAYAVGCHALWRDLVSQVENADAGDADFRDLIDKDEAVAVITGLLSVVPVKPTAVTTGGVRKLTGTLTVKTHAFQNGILREQTHELRRKSEELSKRYDMAQQADTNSERAKAKGDLYDSMLVESTGFKGKTPLRFKTAVMDDVFGRTQIDPKK